MKKTLLFIALLSACISASAARMYQWIDPDTNTTQLSGKPPHWYRTGEAGPRVLVFENGKAIDDTGIELSEVENTLLRQQALIIVEQDRQAAMQKLVESQRQKAVFDSEPEDEDLLEQTFDSLPREIPVEEDNPDPDEASAMAEQMRQLLEEYESLRTQNARELVEDEAP
jgi:hypothetical protein